MFKNQLFDCLMAEIHDLTAFHPRKLFKYSDSFYITLIDPICLKKKKYIYVRLINVIKNIYINYALP